VTPETRLRLNEAITAVSRFGGSQRLAAVHARRSGIPLSLTAVNVLRQLAAAGPMPMTDLAQRCHLALPPLSRTVVALQDQGLAERTRNPKDARSTLVHLTDKGTEALQRFAAANADLLDSSLGTWSDEELRGLADQMLRLVGDLRAGGTGGPG
jgi:DNA-binding MarR family transcriptional regulator